VSNISSSGGGKPKIHRPSSIAALAVAGVPRASAPRAADARHPGGHGRAAQPQLLGEPRGPPRLLRDDAPGGRAGAREVLPPAFLSTPNAFVQFVGLAELVADGLREPRGPGGAAAQPPFSFRKNMPQEPDKNFNFKYKKPIPIRAISERNAWWRAAVAVSLRRSVGGKFASRAHARRLVPSGGGLGQGVGGEVRRNKRVQVLTIQKNMRGGNRPKERLVQP